MNENMMTDAELHAEMTHTAYNRYLRYGVVSNSLMTGSDMLPGYVPHEDFDAKLIGALHTGNVIRSLCSEVTTKDDRIMPVVNGHGQPSWVPEGSTIPIVTDMFDRMVLDSHLLAALLRVTSELLKDSAVDIEQYLADTFASRMAPMEEAAFVAGDGVGKPLGLIHQVQVGCETQAAGTVSIEDVVNLIFSLPEQCRRNGTLLMNEKTLLSLHKQCLAQGTNLWFGKTNDGKDDTFFSYRIVRSSAMPDAETGNTPVLFGDFKKAYVNDCGKRAMNRLTELYAASTHIGFMLAERVGIKLIVPDAIKSLKVK